MQSKVYSVGVLKLYNHRFIVYVGVLKLYNHRFTVQVCSNYTIIGLQCSFVQYLHKKVNSVGVLKLCSHRFTVYSSSAQIMQSQGYSVVFLNQHTLRFTVQLCSNNIHTGLQCSCAQTTYAQVNSVQYAQFYTVHSCPQTTQTQVYSVVVIKQHTHTTQAYSVVVFIQHTHRFTVQFYFKIYSQRLAVQFSPRYIHTG